MAFFKVLIIEKLIISKRQNFLRAYDSLDLHGCAGDVPAALLERLAEVGVRAQVQRGLTLLVLDAQVSAIGSWGREGRY